MSHAGCRLPQPFPLRGGGCPRSGRERGATLPLGRVRREISGNVAPLSRPPSGPTLPRGGGRDARRGLCQFLAGLIVALLLALPADAGTLDRAGVERHFPSPLVVGERDDRIPVWPILKQEAGAYAVFAYAFESIDFARIPGFGGTAPNLLIALAPDGTFRDARVLAHHEPVFLEGLGSEPLFAFVEQYVGLSAKQPIRVGRPNARAGGAAPATTVDGISMATASTRVINETMLAASLAVARDKLGFGGAQLGLRVEARPEGEALPLAELERRGWVKLWRIPQSQADAAFAGTDLSDPEASAPDEAFAELTLAYLNVPAIGRTLLGEAAFARLMREVGPGGHAVMVVSSGRWSPLPETFVLGSVPERVSLRQGGLTVNLRDAAWERRDLAPDLPAGPWTILRIAPEAGFDPSAPWTLAATITRERGQIFPEKVSRDLTTEYRLPPDLFLRETPEAGPGWTDAWRARGWELGTIVAALALLVPVLVRQRGLVAHHRPFSAFRLVFLAFTLGFIGWYAQAQLSVVTLVGVTRAVVHTGDLGFLLYDPPSLLIWAFVLATLVVWGRGTFCGWLCPFGALQEFAACLARPLRIRPITVPPRLDRALRQVKYAALAAILLPAALASPLADTVSEVEPFKTAITLSFVRSAPFVLYAAGLILLNLFVYKGFCRYLCPLGASLALAGRLRLLNWIPRRAECGTPCQLCRVRCRYGAIAPSGRIDYPECFQCMECVTIVHDPHQCVPQVLAAKRGRRAALPPVAAE